MTSTSGPPLDEIQWKGDAAVMGEISWCIHTNTVLFYFKYSPFYDNTSNNEVLFQQGVVNRDMAQFLSTRELFEGRLNTMSGLEFRVAQEPSETGPGQGTGVWVINKQTRQKRQGQEDEITIHATYFIVGWNIYMAPTLFDIISGRVVCGLSPGRTTAKENPSALTLLVNYLGQHLVPSIYSLTDRRLRSDLVTCKRPHIRSTGSPVRKGSYFQARTQQYHQQ